VDKPKTLVFIMKNIALVTVALTSSVAAFAATLTENFDYGSTPPARDLVGLGSTAGEFSSSWTGTAGQNNYQANSNLTYAETGYNNAGNSPAGQGVAVEIAGSNMDRISSRTFDTDLTGTIWISALIRTNGDGTNNSQAGIWLGGENNATFLNSAAFGIRGFGEDRWTRYGNANHFGNNIDAQGSAISRNDVTLALARVSIDYSGTSDRIETWFNPDLSLGAASIGTAQQLYDGSDVFGTGLNRIGLSFAQGGGTNFAEIDNIRISNELDGFDQVTSIPEPSTFLMVASALSLSVFFRRWMK
jgi:hypothetical protein